MQTPDAELAQRAQRANRVAQILDDPAYTETWDMLRAHYVKGLVDAPIDAHEMKTQIQLTIRVLDALKLQFAETMSTGQVAAQEIEKRKKMLDRVKAGWPPRR